MLVINQRDQHNATHKPNDVSDLFVSVLICVHLIVDIEGMCASHNLHNNVHDIVYSITQRTCVEKCAHERIILLTHPYAPERNACRAGVSVVLLFFRGDRRPVFGHRCSLLNVVAVHATSWKYCHRH